MAVLDVGRVIASFRRAGTIPASTPQRGLGSVDRLHPLGVDSARCSAHHLAAGSAVGVVKATERR